MKKFNIMKLKLKFKKENENYIITMKFSSEGIDKNTSLFYYISPYDGIIELYMDDKLFYEGPVKEGYELAINLYNKTVLIFD